MTQEIKKVVRDGKVAVIISCGYGSGWTTCNSGYGLQILFDPEIVSLIEADNPADRTHHAYISDKTVQKIAEYCEKRYDSYLGGFEGLEIRWIPEGKKFKVTEYDGFEEVLTEDDLPFTA
jgi:hypothetical protein